MEQNKQKKSDTKQRKIFPWKHSMATFSLNTTSSSGIWAKTLNSKAEKLYKVTWGYINCIVLNDRIIILWHDSSSTGFWEGWCEEINLCHSQNIAWIHEAIVDVWQAFSFRWPTRVTLNTWLGYSSFLLD